MPTKPDTEITASIKYGDQVLPVRDPHNVQTVAADVVTEWRVFNNQIVLALGTIVTHPHPDSALAPEVIVCSRVRFPLSMAVDVKNMIDNALTPPVPKGEQH